MIGVNDYCKGRHVEWDNYSHFDGSWNELVKMVAANFNLRQPGDKPGSWLVPMDPAKFRAPVWTKLQGGEKLTGIAGTRPNTDDEEAVKESRLDGKEVVDKAVATRCDVVVYERGLLKPSERSTEEPYEIISILAEVDEVVPTDPTTMARNMLRKPGGTYAEYTVEELLESIWFHATHTK